MKQRAWALLIFSTCFFAMEQQKETTLMRAYSYAATQKLQYMYEKPLSLCCDFKKLPTEFISQVNCLLDEGANPNVSNGTEPLLSKLLFLEEKTCPIQLVQKMIAKGADVSARDFEGGTPLMRAAWRGSPAVVKLLLKYGADPKMTDDEGLNALAMANRAYLKNQEIIDILTPLS